MSERTFSVYDQSTGAIERVVSCPEDAVALNVGAGEAFIAGTWPDDEFYMDTASGAAQPKEPMTPAIATAPGEATLTGLPVPCVVSIALAERANDAPAMAAIDVDDGVLTASVDIPGRYRLRIAAPPRYLDYQTEVDIP